MPSIKKPWVITLLALYFCYLVISTAPAPLVAWAVTKAVPNVSLAGVTGSVWSGRAAGASIALDNMPPLALGGLSWQLSPWKLLLLKACIKVNSEKLSGDVCHGITGGKGVKGLQLELPAALANGFIRESGAVVDGNLSLVIEQASLTRSLEVSSLKGNFGWQGAKVSVNGMAFSLGDYGADLTADGNGGLKALVSDISGPIKVNLEAVLKLGQPPKVVGDINPTEQAPAAIRDALGLVATPNENGGFRVVYPLGG